MLSHRNVLANIDAVLRFPLNAQDRIVGVCRSSTLSGSP